MTHITGATWIDIIGTLKRQLPELKQGESITVGYSIGNTGSINPTFDEIRSLIAAAQEFGAHMETVSSTGISDFDASTTMKLKFIKRR